MGFHEVRFPTEIDYGSLVGPGHSTTIIAVDSGAEERTVRWAEARRRYDAGKTVATQQGLYDAYEFILAREGAANGFRWKDWIDYATTVDGRTLSGGGVADPAFGDVIVGVGDGTTKIFQIIKKYVSGPTTKNRTIQKPVSGTVKVGLGVTEQFSGFSVNTVTGEITFTTAPTAATNVTAGCEFDVPVRFDASADDWLPISLDAFKSGSLIIPLVELIDERPAFEDFNYGGTKVVDPMTASLNITPAEAMYWRLNPTAGGLSIFLTEPTGLGTGGPYFYIEHTGPQNSFTVRDDQGLSIVVMSPQVPRAWIMLAEITAAKVWVLIPG